MERASAGGSAARRDKMVEARYPEKAEHIYTLLEHIHLYEKGAGA